MQETIISLVGAVIALGAVLYLCYLFSKLMGKKMTSITASANIKVLEKVVLGQDKFLIIAKVGNSCCLIGVTGQEIRILKELDESELTPAREAKPGGFMEVLGLAMKQRGGKAVDGSEKKDRE